MTTITVPDKICKKCGGNKWYVRPNNGQLNCNNCRIVNIKKYITDNTIHVKNQQKEYKKEQVILLSDTYIKNVIYKDYTKQDIKIQSRDIPENEIIKVRAHLTKVRTFKKAKEMRKSELTKLKELQNLLDPNEKSSSIRDSKRCYLRKQLGVTTLDEVSQKIQKLESKAEKSSKVEKLVVPLASVEEYQETIVMETTTASIVKEPVEDIVDEFKRIEARRQEILQEVETFNNYVESFKIKL